MDGVVVTDAPLPGADLLFGGEGVRGEALAAASAGQRDAEVEKQRLQLQQCEHPPFEEQHELSSLPQQPSSCLCLPMEPSSDQRRAMELGREQGFSSFSLFLSFVSLSFVVVVIRPSVLLSRHRGREDEDGAVTGAHQIKVVS